LSAAIVLFFMLRHCSIVFMACLVFFPSPSHSQDAPGLKHESFDHDPHWDTRNNQITPKRVVTVTQDFGYRTTHFAGTNAGEMGGTVTRAFVPAFYADKFAPKTLNDKLTASGSFALTASHASAGFFFGWFNGNQPGGSRPVGSLGLDVDTEKSGGRLAVRMITAQNKSCGTFITPFIPGKFRPTPIRNDGTRYSWKLTYDPDANSGNGRFEFSITSNADKHEPFESTNFSVDVPEGFKTSGTTFDHFGLMNMGKPGGTLTVFFDDLAHDGGTQDFSIDPGWDGTNNHRTYQPEVTSGAHHYGYSAQTGFAGGSPGEMGGVIWRSERNFGWYADSVGPLTLDHKLEASGRVMLAVGAPDSDAAFGWFSSRTPEDSSASKTNFVGIHIGGPTRVGHYFTPFCVSAQGHAARLKHAPVLVPGKAQQWKLLYDPAANDGNGLITLTLDNESITLKLDPAIKRDGALLDRFGLVSIPPGGSALKIYFDDLTYTASP
jgi:hypothetical protein